MDWTDVQATTTEIVRECPDFLSTWLYMLCTSGKMTEIVSMQRIPTEAELADLLAIPGLLEKSHAVGELVAEYRETSLLAQQQVEAGEV